ncbi:MAG: HlyD family type I secretion periplasmic adaptor subunit [Rhodocyclales bacterium]|nr:HlyD family type I secretion periplasmic adaptor subunit [Rhodocyclales bacterium]
MTVAARIRSLFVPAVDIAHVGDATRTIRLGLLAIAIGFGAFGGWMAFAPLAGAVVAPGVVKVDMNRKTVQHQEGGIVKEIRVRDGDRIRAGQTLIVLDDVRVDAAVELLRNQYDSERARNARLTSERDLSASVSLPRELAARANESKVGEILKREQGLFDARYRALNDQLRLLRMQLGQIQDETRALEKQVMAEGNALRLHKEELEANEQLAKQGFVNKTRILGLQRTAAEYEARRNEHEAELAKSRQKRTDIELRIITLRNNFAQTAADELKESTNRLFDIEERLRPSRDAAERQSIVAPIDGDVVDLKVTSIGAVVAPRDVLLDIVPADGKLIVEGRIRTEDINHVRNGSEADVRLIAFRQRMTPLVEGIVTYVAADRLTEPATGRAYYTIRVDISPESLKKAGDIRLQAGMPVELFVKTEERTPLLYLLEPVTAYLRRALREP